MDMFRNDWGKLLSTSQTSRSDVPYNVAPLHMYQVKYKSLEKKHHDLLNETVYLVNRAKDVRIKIKKLNNMTFRLYVFVDSGYKTNSDCTSSIDVIIFLADGDNNWHFIHWSATKCTKVAKFTLPSETYTFSTGCDSVLVWS